MLSVVVVLGPFPIVVDLIHRAIAILDQAIAVLNPTLEFSHLKTAQGPQTQDLCL